MNILKKLRILRTKESKILANSVLTIFYDGISKSKDKPEMLLKKISNFKQTITDNLPAEPLLSTALKHISSNLKTTATLKHEVLQRISAATKHIAEAQNHIAELGSLKVKKGTIVFTYDHSSSVLNLLLKAKQHSQFKVHMTEAWPSFGSRIMATQLAKNNISVAYYADSELRQALKKADVVFLGAAAMAENGQIYSTIGSELIAEIANKYGIPIYVCMDSWKYNPIAIKELEEKTTLRDETELWSKPPKNIHVVNFAFEKISPYLVTGIITERGIYKPFNLISELRIK